MEPSRHMMLMLWGNLAAVALLLGISWRSRAATVGLPICYLVSLGSIHFVGAWISTWPGSPAGVGLFVARGYRECFAGVVAFTAAVFVTEFVLNRYRVQHDRANNAPRPMETQPQSRRLVGLIRADVVSRENPRRMATAYVRMGVGCALCSSLCKSIPSLAALVHCGAYLLVVGCCLGCHSAWQKREHWIFLMWVACACLFPVFTIITSGFIGYGVFAALMVLSFAIVQYRPRWQALVALAGLAYLALSVYVTYMAGRDQMREAVWGGQPYLARVRQLKEILVRFEFFEPTNEAQLQTIDDRLNQNYLVGAAQSQLEDGVVPWACGGTIWRAFLAMVPRMLWPQKPVFAGGGNLVSEYTGLTFAEFTSVGVGQVMEFYINFGRWGVVIGFFVLGGLLRALDCRAATHLSAGRYAQFVLWYLPSLAFMQTEGSLAEILGTCAASVVVAVAVKKCPLYM